MAKSQKDKGHGAHHKGEESKKNANQNEQIDEVGSKEQAKSSHDRKASNTKTKASKIDIDIDDATAQTDNAQSTNVQLQAEQNKYLRLAAEYDNFRKRSKLERETTYRDARTEAITRLLPVYDNLERALKQDCSDEAFYKGIEMTMTNLNQILENMDVVPIEAVGEPFDPNRHNAVMTIENADLGEKIVAEEFQKGFMLGDKVIRFSTVVVAN